MSDRIVLESSVALSWILPDASIAQRAYAKDVLESIERDRPQIVVPDIFPVEIISVMLRACRLGVISEETRDRNLSRLESLPMQVHRQLRDLAEFAQLGKRYTLPPHDALYVALAKQLASPIAVFDPAIRSACIISDIDVYAT